MNRSTFDKGLIYIALASTLLVAGYAAFGVKGGLIAFGGFVVILALLASTSAEPNEYSRWHPWIYALPALLIAFLPATGIGDSQPYSPNAVAVSLAVGAISAGINQILRNLDILPNRKPTEVER